MVETRGSRLRQLGFSNRSISALLEQDIETEHDLADLTEVEFFRFPRVGQKAIAEAKQALTNLGMSFSEHEPTEIEILFRRQKELRAELAAIEARIAEMQLDAKTNYGDAARRMGEDRQARSAWLRQRREERRKGALGGKRGN